MFTEDETERLPWACVCSRAPTIRDCRRRPTACVKGHLVVPDLLREYLRGTPVYVSKSGAAAKIAQGAFLTVADAGKERPLVVDPRGSIAVQRPAGIGASSSFDA
jgi:hypothetical protein